MEHSEEEVSFMTNNERIIHHLYATVDRLNPEFVRKVMVYADILYKIQMERGG